MITLSEKTKAGGKGDYKGKMNQSSLRRIAFRGGARPASVDNLGMGYGGDYVLST